MGAKYIVVHALFVQMMQSTDQGGSSTGSFSRGWGCMVNDTLFHILIAHSHTISATSLLQHLACVISNPPYQL